jgi:hypothetical protein
MFLESVLSPRKTDSGGTKPEENRLWRAGDQFPLDGRNHVSGCYLAPFSCHWSFACPVKLLLLRDYFTGVTRH